MMALNGVMSEQTGDNRLPMAIETFRTIGSPGYPFDEDRIAARLRLSMKRGFSPAGVGRQFLAVISALGRGEALKSLNVPTLVIHGEDDPLVPLAAGKATAAAIPSATLLTIPGMGHDLPQQLYAQLTNAIADHAAAAEKRSAN